MITEWRGNYSDRKGNSNALSVGQASAADASPPLGENSSSQRNVVGCFEYNTVQREKRKKKERERERGTNTEVLNKTVLQSRALIKYRNFSLCDGFLFLFIQLQQLCFSLLCVSFLQKISEHAVQGQPHLDVNYFTVTFYRSVRWREALWLSVLYAKHGESLTGGEAIFQSAGQPYTFNPQATGLNFSCHLITLNG